MSHVTLAVPTATAMQRLGRRLATLLRPGDLVLLTGDLGAGKTTLTQGIGDGLGVRGDITSPTFVIAREHPALPGGIPLVHVDAYRLGSLAEVDDLDLDTALEDSVTVVEWGSGLVESLTDSRLEVRLIRPRGDVPPAMPADAADAAETRIVEITGYGPRWADASLAPLADEAPLAGDVPEAAR